MPGTTSTAPPPFLMTSTTKQMRPNGKGGGVSKIEGDNYKIVPPRVFNVPAKKNLVEFSEFCKH